jgi:hypothetical protein
LSPRSPKPRMAADAAGITTGDGACRRTSPAMDTGATTDRHSIEVTMGRRSIADRGCGLISAAAGTRRGTPRRIPPLKHGTTARRTSRFRMGCASRIGDVRRFPGLGGRLGWRPKRRFRGEAARCMRRPNSKDRTPGRADPTVGANTGLCTTQRTRGLMPERVRLERIRSLT